MAMDQGHNNAVKKEDALRDADLWAESVIAAGKERLDPVDEVEFLTEVIALLTQRRNETNTFIHGDDAKPG